MTRLGIFLILFIVCSCTSTITRKFYGESFYPAKLQTIAFKEFADVTYKDNTTVRVLYSKITSDSITIVDMHDKSQDPIIKTTALSVLKSIKVYEQANNQYVIYTFEKPVP